MRASVKPDNKKHAGLFLGFGASFWNVKQKPQSIRDYAASKTFSCIPEPNAVIHVQFTCDVSKSLTGSAERPAGLPVALYSRPNPYSWHLCQASRLSVTLADGMWAAHTNYLHADWDLKVMIFVALCGLLTETPVMWRHTSAQCNPSPEKIQVPGSQNIRYGHDGKKSDSN